MVLDSKFSHSEKQPFGKKGISRSQENNKITVLIFKQLINEQILNKDIYSSSNILLTRYRVSIHGGKQRLNIKSGIVIKSFCNIVLFYWVLRCHTHSDQKVHVMIQYSDCNCLKGVEIICRLWVRVPQTEFHFDKCMFSVPKGFLTTVPSRSLGGVMIIFISLWQFGFVLVLGGFVWEKGLIAREDWSINTVLIW